MRTPIRAALLGLLLLAPLVPARAMPVDEYLKLRRSVGFDRGPTYAVVERAPSDYAGRVLELRGIVSGSIQREHSAAFLLTLADGKDLLLDAPPNDSALVTATTRPSVRVLARVVESGVGNVAPLQALGAAYEGEVAQRERDAVLHEQRAAARARQRRVVERSPLASRGYRARATQGVQGPVSELARRYLSPVAQAIYPHYAGFIANHNRRLTMEEVDAITVSLLYFAQRHRVDPRLVVALIIAESDFKPRSTSSKGAMGLGQIMPEEARANGLENPYDPIQNVRTSVNLLRQKLDIYREEGTPDGALTWRQIQLAMAAYNAGAGAVRKYGGVPPYRETQAYVKRVIATYRALCGG